MRKMALVSASDAPSKVKFTAGQEVGDLDAGASFKNAPCRPECNEGSMHFLKNQVDPSQLEDWKG